MNLKAGLPFSLIKNGLVEDYPKLEKNIHTDVVIMGGGISGALTAWYLINNDIPCIVVDARTIGLGSTCASTSLLQYEIDTSLHELTSLIGKKKAEKSYLLCLEAIDKLADIAKKVGCKDFKHKKSLYYAAANKDVKSLQLEFNARKKLGLQVEYLNEEAVFNQTGIESPGAILSAAGAETDAYLLAHCLLQDAKKKGLQVFDRTSIATIQHKVKSVTLTTKEDCIINAKKLVYATGYEVVNYIKKPIVKLESTYATISESMSFPRPFWKDDMLLWNTADPYLYMRSTKDNRIIVGGRDEDFYSPKKRDKLIPEKTKKLTGDFEKIFPHLQFNPEFSWTGTFGSTTDGLPYIGPYKELPNSYFALGFGGNGITFSLVAAEIITDHLLGKKNDDLVIFSFNR